LTGLLKMAIIDTWKTKWQSKN